MASSSGVSQATGPSFALRVTLVLLAVCTFPLIWMGGLVTSHGAGLSVPDWPNSFGYNMFALPWGKWVGPYAGGIFYEHTHRLLGSLVGLLAVAATCLAWGSGRRAGVRRWLLRLCIVSAVVAVPLWFAQQFSLIGQSSAKAVGHAVSGFGSLAILTVILAWPRRRHATNSLAWLITAILLAIIVQGLMGGFRVTETSLLLAKLHAAFGQIVFAGAVGLAVVASSRAVSRLGRAPALVRGLSVLLVGLLLFQLGVGVLMRHDPTRDHTTGAGAGLAIPDWPLHYGKPLPPADSATLAELNRARAFEMKLPPVTLWQVWLHFTHRTGGYITAIVALTLVTVWLRQIRTGRVVVGMLGGFVIAQVTLGVLTILWRKPADVATLHQATAALLLAWAVWAALLAWRGVVRVRAEARLDKPTPAEPVLAGQNG